jgi:hypothetical protein
MIIDANAHLVAPLTLYAHRSNLIAARGQTGVAPFPIKSAAGDPIVRWRSLLADCQRIPNLSTSHCGGFGSTQSCITRSRLSFCSTLSVQTAACLARNGQAAAAESTLGLAAPTTTSGRSSKGSPPLMRPPRKRYSKAMRSDFFRASSFERGSRERKPGGDSGHGWTSQYRNRRL